MSFPTPNHYNDNAASTYPPSSYNSTPSSERGEAADFYGSAPVNHNQYQGQQEVQYDQNGQPIAGERGLGTMAAGGAAAWGANKLSGDHIGSGKVIIGGAIMAQVGKKIFEKIEKKHEEKKHHGHHEQHHH